MVPFELETGALCGAVFKVICPTIKAQIAMKTQNFFMMSSPVLEREGIYKLRRSVHISRGHLPIAT
jgi:hypothetical protein